MWAIALDDSSRAALAGVLGYTSIGCWLCAQLPQVVKNASLRSCEGLALPFLCNWLFGDITNLIGCLLTDQLPFQTYLAMYFCLIDLALVGQFVHYRKLQATVLPPSATGTPRYVTYSTLISSPQQSLILPPLTAPPLRTRSHSGPGSSQTFTSGPSTARPKVKRALYPSSNSIHHYAPDINVTSPAEGSYQAIYEAALDVARAAERASHRRSGSNRRRLSRQTSASAGLAETANEDMTESFHSEMSGQTSSTVAGGSPRGDRARLTQSTGTLLDMRGRSMTRTRTSSHGGTGPDTVNSPNANTSELDGIEGLPNITGLGLQLEGLTDHKRSQSRSVSLARGSGGRGGRRAAGVAFMSVGLLVGWGGWSSGQPGATRGIAHSTGAVIISPSSSSAITNPRASMAIRHPSLFPSPPSSFSPTSEGIQYLLIPHEGSNDGPTVPKPHPPEEPPNAQRIVGRVSAWACTTLYLTSRLPQIWKNFQRKSVEGLSILLFLMAFLGNITYVSSILLNPAGEGDPAEAGHYLLEALPYLLGSGGTLMFDLTIMIQSVIYGSARPIQIPPITPVERSSRRRGHLFQIQAPRRKLRHLEEGHGQVRAHSSGHMQSHSQAVSERTPLLPSPVPGGGATGNGRSASSSGQALHEAGVQSGTGAGTGNGNGNGNGMTDLSRSSSPEKDTTIKIRLRTGDNERERQKLRPRTQSSSRSGRAAHTNRGTNKGLGLGLGLGSSTGEGDRPRGQGGDGREDGVADGKRSSPEMSSSPIRSLSRS